MSTPTVPPFPLKELNELPGAKPVPRPAVTAQTAEASRAPHVGAATPVAPKPAVPTQVPQQKPASIVGEVRKANIQAIPATILAKLQKQKFNSDDLVSPFFRCFLYGDIDSGKTVTAAKFGTPENVRIIMTRQKEQVVGLKGEHYHCFHANTVELFRYAVMYPEAIWPEWAELPDRTLIIDDITQIRDMLNDENTSETVQDMRRISKNSKDDLREMIQLSALTKPMNLIIVGLERSWEEGHEIKVSPDLPPSMSSMLRADLEYVLYLKKNSPTSRTIYTENDREAFIKKDDKGKEQSYFINRFARTKLPMSLNGKGIIKPKETAGLREMWERVRAALR